MSTDPSIDRSTSVRIEEPTSTPANRAERRHPRLTSAEAAASYCRVSERTIQNWAQRGLLPIYIDGPRIYIDLDELEAAFAAHPKEMRDGRRNRWSDAAIIRSYPMPEVEK